MSPFHPLIIWFGILWIDNRWATGCNRLGERRMLAWRAHFKEAYYDIYWAVYILLIHFSSLRLWGSYALMWRALQFSIGCGMVQIGNKSNKTELKKSTDWKKNRQKEKDSKTMTIMVRNEPVKRRMSLTIMHELLPAIQIWQLSYICRLTDVETLLFYNSLYYILYDWK